MTFNWWGSTVRENNPKRNGRFDGADFEHTLLSPVRPYSPIRVIDVFAGPGGLGEGFCAVRSASGQPRFRVCLSIEKDPRAHRTLEIRSFWRQFSSGTVPAAYYDFLRGNITQEELFKEFPLQAKQASTQAWLAELGRVPHAEVRTRIQSALSGADKCTHRRSALPSVFDCRPLQEQRKREI